MAICKMCSFDTSSSISGFAYYENGILKEHGNINLKNISNADIRYETMCTYLIDILNKYNPDIVVAETPPYIRNPKVLIMLSEIVGILRGWVYTNKNAKFDEKMPSDWRKWIKNPEEKIPRKREDCKKWDIQKVKEIFGIDIKNDDEADAILIGYAYIKFIESMGQ